VITHNAAISRMADRIIMLADGRIASLRSNTEKIRDLWRIKGQVLAYLCIA
jgi:ABC-type lipoprotein export system ATPase subunit